MSHFTSVERQKASSGLTTEPGMHTCVVYQVTQPSFALVCCMLTETILYSVVSVYCNCIVTVLLNYTISYRLELM